MGLPQMLHQILGNTDVTTNLEFEVISTLPFEYRDKTTIRLDHRGNIRQCADNNVVSDVASSVTDAYSLKQLHVPSHQFTHFQHLLLHTTKNKSVTQDKITLFSLRPVELLQLCPRLYQYYEWFNVSAKVLSRDEIREEFNANITKCMWIDGLGRRVRLRKISHRENMSTFETN